MITVRRVGVEEIETIAALGERMREESLVPFPEIDLEAAREMLALVGANYFACLAEKDGVPVGFLTAQTGRYTFSREPFVTHEIFYVAPEARGSRAAFLLVRAMESWASSIGVKNITIGVHTGIKPEITGRFYGKLGYRFMGGNFMKSI